MLTLLSQNSYIVIGAMALAFLVAFLLAPPVIAFLRAKKLGQQIRDDGPQRHLGKAGTPTMGGVVILAGLIAGSAMALGIFWHVFHHATRFHQLIHTLGLLGLTVAVAAIGAIDDWGKIKRGRSLGLKAREKLALQFLAAGLFVALLLWTNGTKTVGIPYLGEINLGWWYVPVAVLFIAFMSNAVNLTDGLDGLAGGTSAAAAFALAGIALSTQLPGAIAVTAFLGCLGAACLAFLWFNRHPAKFFMGDTGSLSIGAALAGAALIIKQEALLLLVGLIFLIEAGSVILQVLYFKATKGKRLFKMSPFHHHLELSGWTEPQVVTRAWLLAAVLGAGAFWWFKLLVK